MSKDVPVCDGCEKPIIWAGGRCTACKPYEIEYCTCAEWLVVYGHYDSAEESEESELSSEAEKLIAREYNALSNIPGITLVRPGNFRCLLDGWNGAHFSWKSGQFGSFEILPISLIRKIEQALEDV